MLIVDFLTYSKDTMSKFWLLFMLCSQKPEKYWYSIAETIWQKKKKRALVDTKKRTIFAASLIDVIFLFI